MNRLTASQAKDAGKLIRVGEKDLPRFCAWMIKWSERFETTGREVVAPSLDEQRKAAKAVRDHAAGLANAVLGATPNEENDFVAVGKLPLKTSMDIAYFALEQAGTIEKIRDDFLNNKEFENVVVSSQINVREALNRLAEDCRIISEAAHKILNTPGKKGRRREEQKQHIADDLAYLFYEFTGAYPRRVNDSEGEYGPFGQFVKCVGSAITSECLGWDRYAKIAVERFVKHMDKNIGFNDVIMSIKSYFSNT